jgi:hypothetical protein
MAADWTGRWVADKVQSHEKVASAELVAPQLVKIARKNLPEVFAATTAVDCLSHEILEKLIEQSPDAEFVANIPKEAYITGKALDAAELLGIGIGGFGDLLSSLSMENVGEYRNKELEYIARGLRHHDRVTSFDRIHDRYYRIHRDGLKALTAVFLNAYDLTADHVRTARDRYGAFDLVVITNPNGNFSGRAGGAAAAMECEVHKWGSFLARLNKR